MGRVVLHGEIKVNERAIGRWSAVNKGSAYPDGPDAYLCNVDIYDSQRPLLEFEVVHWRRDGAAVLASKVLWQYGLRVRSN